VSPMRGLPYGEFDHVVWVTMTDDGPRLANLLLEGIHDEDILDEAELDFVYTFTQNGGIGIEPIYVAGDDVSGKLNTRLRITNDADMPLEFAAAFGISGNGIDVPAPLSATIEPNSVEFFDLVLNVTQPGQRRIEGRHDHGSNALMNAGGQR